MHLSRMKAYDSRLRTVCDRFHTICSGLGECDIRVEERLFARVQEAA
jgi:hypothetical protein